MHQHDTLIEDPMFDFTLPSYFSIELTLGELYGKFYVEEKDDLFQFKEALKCSGEN
jgi:hypothetical protein